MEEELSGELSNSFGYSIIKETVSQDSTAPAETYSARKHFVVSSMRVERYYASIKEEVSPLTESANELLFKQDYVGFFTACGSNYIRSIRRAQEVIAIFSFKTSNTEMAQDYAEGLRASGFGAAVGGQITNKTKYQALTETLEINILAYGLGLNSEGEGSLVATSIDEYNDVTRFAFRAMTQSDGGSSNLGMVYSIEVVPWVDNVAFQVASQLHDEAIEVPLPRSVMPRAFLREDPTSTASFNLNNINDYECRDTSYDIDIYGYCCEPSAMYNADRREYNSNDSTSRICRPLRNLDKSIVKNNMATNGEFVCRLDSAVRSKLNQFSTLEKCVSAVRSIPEDMDYYFLRPQASSRFDPEITTSFTVKELKIAIDPFNDYGLVKHMGKEIDEFMDMFYQPCIKALFGGKDKDSDAVNFVIEPWHVHEECLMLSCLSDSMRWNRGPEGGCVSSLISGADAHGYDQEDLVCSYNPELAEASETCKYPLNDVTRDHERFTTCWSNTLPAGKVDYFIEQFCMPNMGGGIADDSMKNVLEGNYNTYCQ